MRLTTNADLIRISRLARFFGLPQPLGIATTKKSAPILRALQLAKKTRDQSDITKAQELIKTTSNSHTS